MFALDPTDVVAGVTTRDNIDRFDRTHTSQCSDMGPTWRKTPDCHGQSYPIRAALESLAAREAALRIDDSTLAKLEEHIASMRRAAEVNDHRAHVDADFAFHHTIIKAAGIKAN